MIRPPIRRRPLAAASPEQPKGASAMTRRVRRGSASDGRQKRNPIAKLLQEKPFQGRAKPIRKI
jgi:hypothetical protein